MLKILNNLFSAIKIIKLPANYRKIIFYSEGKSYWPIFSGIIKIILKMSDLNIVYVTSDKNDPAFNNENRRFKVYLTDEKYVRRWLFANLNANLVVMTMPDLNKNNFIRSNYKVHYLYIQHGLVSLHMAYRYGAFDYFDSIFCAGPHHLNEIKIIEKKYNLPRKKLYKHGYARVDLLLSNRKKLNSKTKIKCILFAPTWGEKASIETGVANHLIEKILSLGFKIIFRPHPETYKLSYSKIKKIIIKYSQYKNFFYDKNISSMESYISSDIMITDWSGSAIEYSLALKKPVIFLDLPKKINNQKYLDIGIQPIEVSIREKIGIVVNIKDITYELITSLETKKININNIVYNLGNSDHYGAKYILEILNYDSEK